jgi:hypothetical protein
MKTIFVFLFTVLFLFSFNVSATEQAPVWQLKTQSGKVINSAQYKNQPIIFMSR